MDNILTDLVNLLTENNVSLSSSLLKIKVLSARLNNEPLLKWVSKELSGYSNDDELPQYRIHKCTVLGDFVNGTSHGYWQANRQVLAIEALPSGVRKRLETMNFREGLSTLESFVLQKQSTTLKADLSPETLSLITKNYQRMGNYDLTVHSGYKEIGVGAVEQTISIVRNTALDLILKLEDEFGFEINMNELIRKKNEVNQIINNTMNQTINNHGDGNLINTGDNSSIRNKVIIEKNNFDSLRKQLEENLVDASDINELETIIDEQPNFENQIFGPKVNTWFQKMVGKSLDGTWQIGIGTAATLLGEILKAYYGM